MNSKRTRRLHKCLIVDRPTRNKRHPKDQKQQLFVIRFDRVIWFPAAAYRWNTCSDKWSRWTRDDVLSDVDRLDAVAYIILLPRTSTRNRTWFLHAPADHCYRSWLQRVTWIVKTEKEPNNSITCLAARRKTKNAYTLHVSRDGHGSYPWAPREDAQQSTTQWCWLRFADESISNESGIAYRVVCFEICHLKAIKMYILHVQYLLCVRATAAATAV